MTSIKRSIWDISLGKNLSISSPDLFSNDCNSRKESPERSNLSTEQIVMTSTPNVLFKLPAFAITQLKLIQNAKEKKYEKV